MVPSPDLSNAGKMLSWSADRIQNGWGLGKFAKSGIGLLIAGGFALAFDVISAITGFLTDPLGAATTAISSLFSGLLTTPLSILEAGAAQSAGEIGQQFTGLVLGPLAFPVGVASLMLGLLVIERYLSLDGTSDLFPGSFSDVNTPDFLENIGIPELGTKEEQPEDEENEGS